MDQFRMTYLKGTKIAALMFILSFDGLANDKDWLKPVTLESTTCADPMIKIEKMFQLDAGGLEGVISNMKEIDRNNDGKACINEVKAKSPGQLHSLSLIDYNQDLCVSVKEMKHAIRLRIESAWEVQFTYLDGNRDKVITINELKNRTDPNNKTGLTSVDIMSEFDLDLNGSITWQEYKERAKEITVQLTTKNR